MGLAGSPEGGVMSFKARSRPPRSLIRLRSGAQNQSTPSGIARAGHSCRCAVLRQQSTAVLLRSEGLQLR